MFGLSRKRYEEDEYDDGQDYEAEEKPSKPVKKAGNKKPSKKPAKKPIPKTIQDTIPLVTMEGYGIIGIGDDNYSKMYRFADSNFAIDTEDGQESTLASYEKLLSHFPINVSMELVIVNKRMSLDEIKSSYYIPLADDELNEYRNEYNHRIIDSKILEGHNDIRKTKYVIMTAHIKDKNDLMSTFANIDVELQSVMQEINKVGVVPLNDFERMELIDAYYKGVTSSTFRDRTRKYFIDGNFSQKEISRMGHTAKDLIAPHMINKAGKGNSMLQLGSDRYCRTYTMIDLPPSLDTSYLSKVTDIPTEMVTTVMFNPMPRKDAERKIRNRQNDIKADILKKTKQAYRDGFDPNSVIPDNLIENREEAAALRKEIVTERKRVFLVTISSTVFGRDEKDLEEMCKLYQIKNDDYSLLPDPCNGYQLLGLQMNALTGGRYVPRDIMLVSSSACALFPFNIQEIQDKNGKFFGINALSKNMIMFDRRDATLPNGLIFGRAGSGKSYFTKGNIIPAFLATNDDIIILDPDEDYKPLANAFGGIVIDLKRNTQFHINPCDMDMEWDDPDADPLGDKCDYMVSLVESILGEGRECNPLEVNCILRVTQKMYQNYIAYMTELHNNGVNITIDTNKCPTLVDFYGGLLEDDSMEGSKLALIVEPYCKGQYDIFAHHTDTVGANRLIVYNMKSLKDKMKPFAMKVCLSHIWNQICKNRGTEKATWAFLDELHYICQTESSSKTLAAYYKRCRKYHGIMTGITQDITDLLYTTSGLGMLENSGFIIFMNQSPTGRQKIKERYQLPDVMCDYVHDKGVGKGLAYMGKSILPFDYKLPTDTKLHKLMTTTPSELANIKLEEENAAKALPSS